MLDTREPARVIMEREGLRQISDSAALSGVVEQVIAANPKQVEQYRSGKTTVLAFFVGQVMKATKGQANPAAVNEILREKLPRG
jgi:aspartyl-tRNA(Asn)/glutamyl-tRNA(Gln) amidotransferase subunit B